MISEAANLKELEGKFSDFMREFMLHYDLHIEPHFKQAKRLPMDCKYCRRLVGASE